MQGSLTAWQAIAVATQFGVTIAVAVGLGFFLGDAIDSWLGLKTIPVFTLLGVFAGLISAMTSMIQLVRMMNRRNQKSREKEPKD